MMIASFLDIVSIGIVVPLIQSISNFDQNNLLGYRYISVLKNIFHLLQFRYPSLFLANNFLFIRIFSWFFFHGSKQDLLFIYLHLGEKIVLFIFKSKPKVSS